MQNHRISRSVRKTQKRLPRLPVDDGAGQLLNRNRYRLRSCWCLECNVWPVYVRLMINSRSDKCPLNLSQLNYLCCQLSRDLPYHYRTYSLNLCRQHYFACYHQSTPTVLRWLNNVVAANIYHISMQRLDNDPASNFYIWWMDKTETTTLILCFQFDKNLFSLFKINITDVCRHLPLLRLLSLMMLLQIKANRNIESICNRKILN